MSGTQAVSAPAPLGLAATPGRGTAPWRRFGRNRLALFGGGLIAVVALVALAAPLLPLADPDHTDILHRLALPLSPGHPLGTDELGRDLLSRLVWGTRLSLAVGLGAALLASAGGSLIGMAAAYYGGAADLLLMRGIDMLMAFPYLLLALAIVAAIGPSLLHAMIAIVVVNIPFFARAVRGATLSIRRSDFIAAAQLSGQSSAAVIVAELLPNVLPVIVVTASTSIGWMILETAGLSFLGLGAQPPQADLGGMLGNARNLINVAPHVAAVPGLAILVIATGVNLVGDGVRDMLDPRLRAGGLARSQPATEVMSDAAQPPAATPGAVLEVLDLSTQFRAGREIYRAVNGVDLTIHPGEAVGIVGESGSGKTVTALSILRLVATPPGQVVGGAIRFLGQDLLRMRLATLQAIRGNRIAYVFQDPLTTLNPLMAVGRQVAESIARHQRVGRKEAARQAIALLESVQIPDAAQRAGAYPHELSGGQRQRVGIALALANRPDLIVADEPTTALDVTTQAHVLELMKRQRQSLGAALIFISHDFGVVAELCDRVHVMYGGRIVESGTVAQVLERPAHPYTARLLACVPKLGESGRKPLPIPGLPPATNALPPGCAFAPRCQLALDACRQGDIALVAVATGHTARCIRTAVQLAEAAE